MGDKYKISITTNEHDLLSASKISKSGEVEPLDGATRKDTLNNIIYSLENASGFLINNESASHKDFESYVTALRLKNLVLDNKEYINAELNNPTLKGVENEDLELFKKLDDGAYAKEIEAMKKGGIDDKEYARLQELEIKASSTPLPGGMKYAGTIFTRE